MSDRHPFGAPDDSGRRPPSHEKMAEMTILDHRPPVDGWWKGTGRYLPTLNLESLNAALLSRDGQNTAFPSPFSPFWADLQA